jgi:hypothetical protein
MYGLINNNVTSMLFGVSRKYVQLVRTILYSYLTMCKTASILYSYLTMCKTARIFSGRSLAHCHLEITASSRRKK